MNEKPEGSSGETHGQASRAKRVVRTAVKLAWIVPLVIAAVAETDQIDARERRLGSV